MQIPSSGGSALGENQQTSVHQRGKPVFLPSFRHPPSSHCSRFALEPQARERCLFDAPGMPGGPTKLFKGLGFYAGRPRDWNPLVWGIARCLPWVLEAVGIQFWGYVEQSADVRLKFTAWPWHQSADCRAENPRTGPVSAARAIPPNQAPGPAQYRPARHPSGQPGL